MICKESRIISTSPLMMKWNCRVYKDPDIIHTNIWIRLNTSEYTLLITSIKIPEIYQMDDVVATYTFQVFFFFFAEVATHLWWCFDWILRQEPLSIRYSKWLEWCTGTFFIVSNIIHFITIIRINIWFYIINICDK